MGGVVIIKKSNTYKLNYFIGISENLLLLEKDHNYLDEEWFRGFLQIYSQIGRAHV